MRTTKGFTLIELMVVIAIIGIIAAIAIPAYTESVHKGHRADAVRTVGQLQLQMERWRAENPSYVNCTGAGCGSGTYPAPPTSDYYTITLTDQGPTAYTITATPGGVQDPDRCGNLVANLSDKTRPTWSTASCN